MIRRLWKTLKLGFDRSFSGASWKQITWLFGILALVLGFSLWIKSYCTAELHDMRILELLLDPGSFVLQDGDPLGYERLPLLALTVVCSAVTLSSSMLPRSLSTESVRARTPESLAPPAFVSASSRPVVTFSTVSSSPAS